MAHTIGSLVDFVMRERRGKAFVGWTPIEIAGAIQQGIEDNSMCYSAAPDGRLDGIVVANRHMKDKVIYVTSVLTTRPGVFASFMRMFTVLYPEFSIEAERRGKTVKYDTKRLVEKVI